MLMKNQLKINENQYKKNQYEKLINSLIVRCYNCFCIGILSYICPIILL